MKQRIIMSAEAQESIKAAMTARNEYYNIKKQLEEVNNLIDTAAEGFVSRAEDAPEEFTTLNDMFDEFVSWCITYCNSEGVDVPTHYIKHYLIKNYDAINELIDRFKA